MIVLTPAGINILQHSTDRINKLMDKRMIIDEQKAKELNSLLEEIRKSWN